MKRPAHPVALGASGVVVAAATLVATAGPTLAHGLGGRSDLPVPVWMFAYGAAGALVVSFVALAVSWPTARFERVRPAWSWPPPCPSVTDHEG